MRWGVTSGRSCLALMNRPYSIRLQYAQYAKDSRELQCYRLSVNINYLRVYIFEGIKEEKYKQS